VSVVGDFNEWDPTAHPLRRRSNGTRSVSIDLTEGSSVQFKYLDDNGDWFPERQADGLVVNEWGEVNSRLDL
jgi:1,4-alpha-glucan branching enzyme